VRNPGRPSQASQTASLIAIDCRNRPPPPERLDAEERELWERIVFSRRPRWFVGCETILETFTVEAITCRRIEMAMRKLRPGGKRYSELAKLRHNSARLCASLSVKLKLLPSTVVQRNVSADGDRPLSVNGLGYPVPVERATDEVAATDEHGERSFERLRQSQEARGLRPDGGVANGTDQPPAATESEGDTVSNLDSAKSEDVDN
jgi:hypothetical protein